MTIVKETAKAVAAGLGAAATYLIGVAGAEGSLSDLTAAQWLGLIPVVLVTYGITWGVPNQASAGGGADEGIPVASG